MATDGARVHVQTSDISFGGVQLSARAGDLVLEVGAEVELDLTVEAREEPLKLKGRVAWKRNEAVGIAFESMDEMEEKAIQRMVDSALGLGVEDQLFSDDEVTADLAGANSDPTELG